MDFQSAMETFAEAWVAANAGAQTQALALTRPKSPKKELSLSPASSITNDRHELLNRTPTGLQSISRTTTSTPVELVMSRSPKNNINTNINNNNNTNSNNNSSNLNINSNILSNINSSNNNSNSGMITPSHLSPPAHHSNINLNSNNSNINNNNNNNNSVNINQIQPPPTLSSCHHSNSTSSLHSFSGGNLGTKFMNSNNSSNNNSILENGNNNNNCGTSDINNEQVLPSPTIERKEFDFTKVNSKSLPLHCIVESFTSLQASMINDIRSPWKRRSNIETDSYVIIPSVTPFCDIVKTALQSLGYSIDIANTAKGTIIIKNWKPLALEKITDSPLVSVGEILGELTSVITLRISVIRTKPSSVNDIKDKLLKLLVLQSHTALRSTGCPLDEILLSQICRNTTFPFEVSDDLRRKFDQWWSNQITPQANPIATKILPPFVNPNTANVKNDLEFAARHLHVASREQLENHHHNPHHNMIVHPALQTVHSQYPSQKTRMRTSFDPEMELPKLQKWFQENPHPSRQQIQSYVIQLNSLESRRGRKPLDVNNVVYWFKNARAAQKRAEIRGHGLGNGYGPSAGLLMSHSDYMKSPHSIPSEDIDNLSQHSDDMDDEMDRPVSPQVPLSLTTHERNRSPINIDDVKIENDRSNSSPPLMSTSQELSTVKNERSETDLMNHSGELRAQNNDSPKTSPTSEELDMDDSEMTPNDFRSPSPDSRRDLPFPIVPNSMFSHSIMYMSHYIPAAMGQGHHATPNSSPNALGPVGLNLSNLSNDERRKRNRTFIDPVTEVPKLEQWFAMNTHPSHNLILKYTEDLNRMPYRQKFPRLESKNVQFWFKNRRAKCKRLKMSLYDTSQLSALSSFHPGDRD